MELGMGNALKIDFTRFRQGARLVAPIALAGKEVHR